MNFIKLSSYVNRLKYYIILDFEANCDKLIQPEPLEIIEFPTILIEKETLKQCSIFHEFVRPTVNTKLTSFCTQLTGIHPNKLKNEDEFPVVMQKFQKWYESNNLSVDNTVFITCGNWDLNIALKKQCQFLNMEIPNYFSKWINIKEEFCNLTHKWPSNGLEEMLLYFKLTHFGRKHSGIDDCRNILQLIVEMSKRNYILKESCNPPVFGLKIHESTILYSRADSAYLGRMQLGKCVSRNFGYVGCRANVINFVNRECSGKIECSFQVSNPKLLRLNMYLKDVSVYLDVRYHCVKVIKVAASYICNNLTLNLSKSMEYIQNWTFDTCSNQFPLKLSVIEYEKLHLIFYNFASESLSFTEGNEFRPTNSHYLQYNNNLNQRSKYCLDIIRYIYEPVVNKKCNFKSKVNQLSNNNDSKYIYKTHLIVYCKKVNNFQIYKCGDGEWMSADKGKLNCSQLHLSMNDNVFAMYNFMLIGIGIVIIIYIFAIIVCIVYIKRSKINRSTKNDASSNTMYDAYNTKPYFDHGETENCEIHNKNYTHNIPIQQKQTPITDIRESLYCPYHSHSRQSKTSMSIMTCQCTLSNLLKVS
ncbi:hypothetical protein A3Q56_00592 [Intoshia linei]|uniref:Exonuclease domain-containing protein n=1 Tax=Intoshia linei TaxID=1819745 RepID=A0A177BBB0_9BILA|nr:hypothetical protein A3Q56_00592 [Intoshia linei]